MRKYKNLPHPTKQPEKFNEYLINNNKVVIQHLFDWILIENSFIENQLVLFAKRSVQYFNELNELELKSLQVILYPYKDKHVYINADKDKSVPNRFHLHIKL